MLEPRFKLWNFTKCLEGLSLKVLIEWLSRILCIRGAWVRKSAQIVEFFKDAFNVSTIYHWLRNWLCWFPWFSFSPFREVSVWYLKGSSDRSLPHSFPFLNDLCVWKCDLQNVCPYKCLLYVLMYHDSHDSWVPWTRPVTHIRYSFQYVHLHSVKVSEHFSTWYILCLWYFS
jgi:hypothetical protein